MSLRRNAVVQIVFTLLLLCAQQGAITHQIWHATPGPHAQSEQKAPDSNKNRLCDLHASLGTVLGAVNAVVAAAPLDASSQFCFIAAAPSAASVSPLAPLSRGPPQLL
jgi:hypothetical protein